MNKKCKIGVFDSGIGGVTVLKEILKLLPNEEYIYYSDSIHNPYGDNSDENIITYSRKITKILLKKECDAIVIACNTASAKAASVLRKEFKDVPIIAIEPAYKMVHDFSFDKNTLLMATKGTLDSEKFNELYKKYDNHKTYLLACKGLADIIEKGNKEELYNYLKKLLTPFSGKIENVVLGCTHYPLAKNEIKDVLGDVTFFDGAKSLAIHLKEVLQEQKLVNNTRSLKTENIINIKFIDSSGHQEKEERFYKILNSYLKQ